MTQSDGTSIDRRALWLAIAGAVGLIIAVVALIIAISAKNASVNDAKVTAEVKRAAGVAVAGIHSQLQHDIASATSVTRQLEASSHVAARERDTLVRDVNQNKSGIATSRASLARMQVSIRTLTADVQRLNGSVTRLTTNQQALTKKVNALSKKKP